MNAVDNKLMISGSILNWSMFTKHQN